MDIFFQDFKPNKVEGLDILEWIPKIAVAAYKTVTYQRYTITVRPEKDETYRVRITASRDRIEYEDDVSTHTAFMESFKTHWN